MLCGGDPSLEQCNASWWEFVTDCDNGLVIFNLDADPRNLHYPTREAPQILRVILDLLFRFIANVDLQHPATKVLNFSTRETDRIKRTVSIPVPGIGSVCY